MYLSRIKIDCGLPSTMKALASRQVMHAIIARCFESSERKLWRLDDNNLLIVSTNPPSDIDAAKQLSRERPETKAYDPFLSSIENGKSYHFRLTANPVRSGPPKGGRRGKIIPCSLSGQLEWICTRSRKSGFVLNECFIAKDEILNFRRGDGNVILKLVTYSGSLTVTDKDELIKAMTFGIGRAKAYGAGLLTLTR